MMTQTNGEQLKIHCLTIEDLVPAEHFLRKLNAVVDFTFIYDEVRELYSKNNGRPGIDPVALVKYLLVGYLYGIESERRIEQEIQVYCFHFKTPRNRAMLSLRRKRFERWLSGWF